MLVMLFGACERSEEIEVAAPYKPKVVVSCFLQGQSNVLLVAVTQSQPVFNVEPTPGLEPTPAFIKDASVTIQQGLNRYILTYDTIENLYRLDIPDEIQGDEQYALTVTSGNNVVTGTTTIPGTVNVNLKLQFDSTLQSDQTYQYRATIACTMLDAGKHYIGVYPVLVYDDSSRYLMYTEGIDRIIEIAQGETATKTVVSSFSAPGIAPVRMEVIIATCDKAFAKNSNRVFDLLNTNFSPFIEPAITYSNMSGGIGVMGSFNPETRYSLNLQ